jgi:oligo-1,6-glucosidase
MQWDSSPQAGFTTGPKPWLAVNPNYKKINAALQLADPDSIYHYTQRMIALRHSTPALIYGDYMDLDPSNPSVFTYTRTLGADRYLIVLNFSENPIAYSIPGSLKPISLLMTNRGSKEVNTSTLNLKGWEARVYKF